MQPTLPTPPLTTPPVALTIDEALALRLTTGHLAALSAYVAVCGGSLLSWYAR